MVEDFKFFVGIDWATVEHQVAIVDAAGTLLRDLKVQHDGEALEQLVRGLEEMSESSLGSVAVSIETPHGAVVDVLLERGAAVFSVNPKQLDRFRDRHTVAGAKDDRRDAFVLADSLRTDMKLFRRVELGDATVVELRELSRARDVLTAEAVAIANRLSEQVHRYYPQLLELGSFHDDLWLHHVFDLAPTPAQAKHVKRAKIEALVRKYRIRRFNVDEIMAILRKKPLGVAPGIVEGSSSHAIMLLARLRLVHSQRRECDAMLKKLIDQMDRPTESQASMSGDRSSADKPAPPRAHRDADILLSLPGAGLVIGATMLAEATSALAARDYHALRTRCGVAPVSKQTGKQKQPNVSMRYACHPRLRNAVHTWAGLTLGHDPRCRAHYRRLRAAGHNHARALRGIADRLLAMLVSMLRSGSLYDPNLRRTIVPIAASGDAAPA